MKELITSKQFTTFNEMHKALADKAPDKVALVCGSVTYTFAELDRAIDNVAAELIKKGIKKNDHVAICSFNSANWVVAFHATVRIGAVAVLVNYSLTAGEIGDLIAMTDVKYILFGPMLCSVNAPGAIYEIAAGAGIEKENLFDISPDKVDFKTYDKLSGDKKDELDKLAKEDDGRHTSYIIFTTGTTSAPKAVMLNQRGVLLNNFDSSSLRKTVMGDSTCITLPMFHIFAHCVFFMYWYVASAVYLEEKISADTLLDTLLNTDIADLATVSTLLVSLTEKEEFPKIRGRIRLVITGGGALTPVQFMKLETTFDNAFLVNGYGQSEHSGSLTTSNLEDPLEERARSVGRPLRKDDFLIYDKDLGELPQGQIGEIVAKGEAVMNGYYKLPKDKQAVDDNGYLHTGDLGYLDEKGNLHLAGRIKDMIVKSGENLSPYEIEDAMTKCEEIKFVKVFGAAHQIFGESVESCIVLNEGYTLDEAKLRKDLRKILAPAKVPSHFFVYDEFPLADNGKLDQRSLKISMLRKLRLENVKEELKDGMVVLDSTFKNTTYNIMPISDMLKRLSLSMGYSDKSVYHIALAVEEMLTERIINAYEDIGDVRFRIIFMPEWMRLEFSDSGKEYNIDENRESSLSARIILKMVSNYTCVRQKNNPTRYCLDFLYEKTFDINNFVLTHERKEN